MQCHFRRRRALAVSLCVLSGAVAAQTYSSPRIQSVVVMEDLKAIAIMGENFPLRQNYLQVVLGPEGEPGDITSRCKPAAPLSKSLVCTFTGGLPPDGDYLLTVTDTRAKDSVSYGLTIGAVGAQGPAGPKGDRGAAGATGPTGPAGLPGTPGAAGPAGPTGIAGPVGPAGETGAAGAAGPAGPIGPTGVAGPTGSTGPIGPAGPVGQTGATGAVGPVGATGPVGAAGATGAVGPIGPIGPTGLVGATGPAGPAGAVGPAGPAGANGAVGAVGPQGLQGIPGPVGPAGPAVSDARFGTNTSSAANGRPYECVMGTVTLAAGGVAGGTRAEGQILSIAQNQALFSLLGVMYGGDGRTTFALPDLRSAAPNGLTYWICATGIYPSRE